ncbi:MAG: O-antigen ligase family protein [Akkermansiaceae bacterium]|nr:O-antigen ligase family protein [Akkermansiaceae bacterium]
MPAGPGSVTQSSSFRALRELAAVIIAVVTVGMTAQTKAWKSVVGLISVIGAIIAGVGIYHKSIAAKSVWLVDEWHAGSFFAPYIYNANAASLMNLSCALSLGFFFGQRKGPKSEIYRGLWLINSLICGIGVMAAGSKGAIIILVVMLLATLFLNQKRLLRLTKIEGESKYLAWEKRMMLAGITALILGFGLVASQNLVSRTQELYSQVTEDGYSESIGGRTAIMGLMLDMIKPSEGGWPGFGPGSFRHIVPYFAVKPEFNVKGSWHHGHCDPLQTVVEWGYFGAAAWFTFGIGAVIAGMRTLSRKSISSSDRPLIRSVMIALAATGLHSCFDFPLSIYSIHLCAMLLCGILWGLYGKKAA